MFLPLLWMISTSLKGEGAMFTQPPEFLPRVQEQVEVPGRSRPALVYRLEHQGEDLRVAHLGNQPGQAEVLVLEPATRAGDRLLVPLQRETEEGKTPTLDPVKHVAPEWSNYAEAATAMELQGNWLAFEIPGRRVHLGSWTVQVGPWISEGLPLRNAFVAFYLNSLLVSLVVTVGTVVTSALAAFAFARLQFPGRDALFLGYLGTLMVPYVVTMIPIFALLRVMGLIDTYFALIVPVMFTAYGVFLLRQFFLSIPGDLEDAARLDGCGNLGVLRHVVVPLAKPALATLATFTFLGTWNSFMWPLIVMNSTEKMPLMLGLYSFMGEYAAQWNLLMAASVMIMAPVIVVFLLGQRYFIEGIVLSGMKG
jgi:multiple sugar transport system permease protein